MEIVTVRTKKELREFVLFPWQVYKNDPMWVPPLISDVETTLDKSKNPFWKHAEGEFFLVKREGKVVGRIAALIDRLYLKKHNDDVGNFGFFETIPDFSVAQLLLSQAREWLKVRGMKAMRGPMSPSANDECALLVDGFNTPPYIMMTHNPIYYVDFMDKFGLKKVMDWFAYASEVPDTPPQVVVDAAQFAKKYCPDLTIRSINMKKISEEALLIKDIYNSAWADNWGFVPMTDAEMEVMAERLKPLAIPDLILFAEVDGKSLGVLVAVPNYNEVLKRMNGRFFPFGIFKFLYYSGKIKSGRVLIMGVKKEYRLKGIEAVLYLEALKRGRPLKYREYEGSMILENNLRMRQALETFGARAYKTYRIYEMKI